MAADRFRPRGLGPALPLARGGQVGEPCLFLAGHPGTRSRVALFGLHLQDRAEQLLRGDRQKTDLCVGVQAIQVGTLGGQVLVDVLVVALVRGGWSGCRLCPQGRSH